MTMRQPSRWLSALATLLAVLGCAPAAAHGGASDDRIDIVVSTDVWADVIRSIGGNEVTVTTIIDSSTADPHSYRPTAMDALHVSEADLVVHNGGGYDTFMATLAESVGPAEQQTVAAFEAAGHDSGNEHIWYRPDDVARVATELTRRLERLHPAGTTDFHTNMHSFLADLDDIDDRIDRLGATHGSTPVLSTSPLAQPLITAAQLANVTPPEFTEAVEADRGIPVLLQHRVSELLANNEVSVLVHNEQTSGPVVARLVELAEAAGIPVVGVSETLPETSEGYLAWFDAQLTEFNRALEERDEP